MELHLRQAQQTALAMALKNRYTYLAMDMGTGKTAVALKWAEAVLPRLKGKGILILAPVSLIYTTWPDEIEKWDFKMSYTVIHGLTEKRKIKLGQKKDLYIMNYEGLPWLYEQVYAAQKAPFAALIVDESAKLKSHTTKRWKALNALSAVTNQGGRLFLCGRPMPQSALDLWAQYKLLDNGASLFSKVTYFYTAFCEYVSRIRKYKVKEECLPEITRRVSPITYRIALKECVDVPAAQFLIRKVTMSSGLQKQYVKFKKDFVLQADSVNSAIAITTAIRSNKLRQFVQGGVYYEDEKLLQKKRQELRLTGKSTINPRMFKQLNTLKLDALCQLVEETDKPMLVAIQFRFELDMILTKFPNVDIIAGKVPIEKRTDIFRRWNTGATPMLVCHPASLSHGANLQFGSNVIVWYALPWSVDQYEQLNARLVRPGQTQSVLVYHLMIKDSVDFAVRKALKQRITDQMEFLKSIKQAIM